jgi:hypothetical protein
MKKQRLTFSIVSLTTVSSVFASNVVSLTSGGSVSANGGTIISLGQPLIGLTAAQPSGVPSVYLGFVPCALADACPADVDDGSGSGIHDGAVTIDDLLYFLVQFEAGDVRADLDNGSGGGVRDGAVTIDDLLFFLAHFEGGC